MTSPFETLINNAVSASFQGWDFSFVDNRFLEESTSWDYRSLLLNRIPKVNSLLDIDTGGGEFLRSMGETTSLPLDTSATEKYLPNIPIASAKLSKLGIDVYKVSNDAALPFADESFDLIVCRHGSFNEKEIFRILKKGGEFITQQVGGSNNFALNQVFSPSMVKSTFEWSLASCSSELLKAGFCMEEALEEFPHTIFKDIGAIVYYLKAIPWQIPDFDVQGFLPQLQILHEKIQKAGHFETSSHRFLVQCRK